MEYPKYIFLISVILAVLTGICLMGVELIGFTGFLLLLLVTLPVYWLEIYWERKARELAVSKGKLQIFYFKERNLEFFIYLQMLLVFALALPDLMIGIEGLNFIQNLLGLVFSVLFVISRFIKDYPLSQTVTIDSRKMEIRNYGYVKNIEWETVTGIDLAEEVTQINFNKKKSHEVFLHTFDANSRKRLLDSIKQLAEIKGLPINYPKNGRLKASTLNKIFKKLPKLVVFMLFLVIDICLVTDLIITLTPYAK